MSTDSEIIQRSLQQPAAFAELFDRHARSVNAFATYRIGRHAAEDVLSETFLVAFRRRADYDANVESAVPWLLGIASRVIRRHRAVEAKHWRSFAGSVAGEEHLSDGGFDEAMTRVDAERRVQSMTSTRELAPMIASLSAAVCLGRSHLRRDRDRPRRRGGAVRSRINRVRTRLAPTFGVGAPP
ncbi:RNA polymerase sigma factor [Microbacterium sp. NPDC055665]